jgi:hypothetical protein
MSGAIHLLPLPPYAVTSRTGTILSLHFSCMYKVLILSADFYQNGITFVYFIKVWLT